MTNILRNEEVPHLEKEYGLVPLSICHYTGQPNRSLSRARYLRVSIVQTLLHAYCHDSHAQEAVFLTCNFYSEAAWWLRTPNTQLVLERAVTTVCLLASKGREQCSGTS